MQLLQQRDFSGFFSDTFRFIKENGAHFFTNYFIINGIFLLIQMVKNYYTNPMDINFMLEITYIIFAFIFGIVNWTFVTIYMILYSKRGLNFDYKDVIDYYKQNVGKIVVFILVSVLLMIPIIIAFYISLILVAITIVGPFLLYAALIIWFTLAFYEYLYSDQGILDSYGYAWKLFTKKFWATTGSTALLYLIVFIIYGVVLGLTGVFGAFFNMNGSDPVGSMAAITKAFSSPIVLVEMTLLSVLMVVVQISQGIIYFSQKEQFENISAGDDIDQIGKIEF